MEIAYNFTPKEIKKLSKFKNPSIVLKKDNIIKHGKYEIHLTKNMFNRLLEKDELKYFFTDKRKKYYMQNGGNLGNIFKAILPHAIKFGKKLIPALGITAASTLTSHGISKALNKKRGGNILKIDLKQADINKIDMLNKLLYRCTREYNHIYKYKQLWQQW